MHQLTRLGHAARGLDQHGAIGRVLNGPDHAADSVGRASRMYDHRGVSVWSGSAWT